MTVSELKYLMAINELYDGSVGIKLVSIADRMKISKVSVYKTVVKLDEKGYVKRDENNKVIMTAQGHEQLELYNKLIGYLYEHFRYNCNISAETAYNDAVSAVCALSDESRQALIARIAEQNR
ncbi:MAG: hypothetical protein IJ446_04465 [Oscillospiraceae bacterium]|nr:hypothetical protein [Oscillospiraceae bacterium]